MTWHVPEGHIVDGNISRQTRLALALQTISAALFHRRKSELAILKVLISKASKQCFKNSALPDRLLCRHALLAAQDTLTQASEPLHYTPRLDLVPTTALAAAP
jgi:hypothetical protein